MVEVNLDLLVMAHPERVAFFLSLASSSSELMNNECKYDITWVRYVLVFLSVGWLAIRGLFCNHCLYFLSLLYSAMDSLRRPLKRVGESRSRFLNKIAFPIIQWFWHKIKIQGLWKASIGYIVNPTGKERITTWASWKRLIPKCAIMANLKATFTAERCRHFDILQAKRS